MKKRKVAPDPAGGMGSSPIAKMFGKYHDVEPLKSVYSSIVAWTSMMQDVALANSLDDLKPEHLNLLQQAEKNASPKPKR